jgi:hypothetical protein
MIVNVLVIISASLAALTKLIDVISSIKRIRTWEMERNPFGRVLFKRFGVAGGCWVTFGIQVLICALVAWDAVAFCGTAEKIVVIVFCYVLTYGNISTGLHNMWGYDLPFTKSMIRFYGWLSTKIG